MANQGDPIGLGGGRDTNNCFVEKCVLRWILGFLPLITTGLKVEVRLRLHFDINRIDTAF